MVADDYIPALAALAGSAIGGLTSMATAWLTHRSQAVAQLRQQDKERRQQLYKEFIEEASALYADALSHSLKDADAFVGLYAKISRMHILSSTPVVEAAEQVMHLISGTYLGPDRSFAELMQGPHPTFDPLRDFSDACRAELRLQGYL